MSLMKLDKVVATPIPVIGLSENVSIIAISIGICSKVPVACAIICRYESLKQFNWCFWTSNVAVNRRCGREAQINC